MARPGPQPPQQAANPVSRRTSATASNSAGVAAAPILTPLSGICGSLSEGRWINRVTVCVRNYRKYTPSGRYAHFHLAKSPQTQPLLSQTIR